MNINHANLRSLRILSTIYEERSVSQAADRLGMSQSAVSHALSQLRSYFNDDLFLKNGSGMSPTPKAMAICQRLPNALRDLEKAISPDGFDPRHSKRQFRISCGDYIAASFAPLLAERLRKQSPNSSLVLHPISHSAFDDLRENRIDVLISGVKSCPDTIRHEALFNETNVWTMRKNHPLSQTEYNHKSAKEYGFIDVDFRFGRRFLGGESYSNSAGIVQWIGTNLSSTLKVRSSYEGPCLSTFNFLSAMELASRSDMLTALPYRMAKTYSERFNLIIRCDWPIVGEGIISQAWFQPFEFDPANSWFRDLIRSSAEDY